MRGEQRDNYEKQQILKQIITDCNIDDKTLNFLIDENLEINDEFFRAFETLNKIENLRQVL